MELGNEISQKLMSIYESLSDEQKARVKDCSSMEEVMSFAANEGIELPDEMLDAVAGGYIFANRKDGHFSFDVINDSDGEVLAGNLDSRKKAEQKALDYDVSTSGIVGTELDQLRQSAVRSSCI